MFRLVRVLLGGMLGLGKYCAERLILAVDIDACQDHCHTASSRKLMVNSQNRPVGIDGRGDRHRHRGNDGRSAGGCCDL